MSYKLQAQIKQNATDIRSYIDDLYNWEEDIKNKNQKKKVEPKKENAPQVPIRGAVELDSSEKKDASFDKTQEKAVKLDPTVKPYKRDMNTVSDYYKAWDKFNVVRIYW
jgi:hypothetical protein